MSQPTDGDSARERILSATAALLETVGPKHLSTRAIAKEAGVSAGLVHHHFVGKDELFIACLEPLFGALMSLEEQQRAALEDDGDVRAVLRHTAREGYTTASRHRVLVRVIKKLVAEKGALPATVHEGVTDPFLHRWSTMLAARTGLPLPRLRFRLHATLVVVGRLAVASDREVAALMGPEARADDLETCVGDLAADIVAPIGAP